MQLDTPCLVIDADRLENNIRGMADLARRHHVALRPHIKTHKSVEIARMQLAAGACGITVAKVSEAEIMVDAGIDDIFIAYPVIGPIKLERLTQLAPRCRRLIVGIDSLAGAKALDGAARASGLKLEVRLEVDIGFARTGIAGDGALDLARAVSRMSGLDLTGIFAFKAMTLAGKPTLDLQAAGEEEGRLTVALADQIRADGIPLADVSAGSTPTAAVIAAQPGITEIRPGTYVFNDMATVGSGSCQLADCAAGVLVTVVSSNGQDRLVVDGGSKTFSTDSQPGTPPLCLEGFGRILEDGQLVFNRMTEEHGMMLVKPGAKDHQVGDQLLVIPNHICTTVNLHPQAVLIRNRSEIVRRIKIDARGCVT